MFQTWRSKLREAEEALKRGRIEKASQLVRNHNLVQYAPGQHVAAKVANSLIERAAERAGRRDFSDAWRDLEAAQGLGGESEQLMAIRDELICRSLDDVEYELRRDRPDRAIDRLKDLEQHQVANDRLRKLSEAAERLETADRLSRQGKFAEAEEQLAAVTTLVPDYAMVENRLGECRDKMKRTRQLTDQMQRTLTAADWQKSLELAEQLLDLAPEYELAQDAHRRAATKLNGRARRPRRPADDTHYWPQTESPRQRAQLVTNGQSAEASSEPRFLLWIDAVGGYFVCPAREVVIGQAVPDTDVDLPIQGDLSRHHAVIRRQGEDYVIEPIGGAVCVAGQRIDGPELIGDGDEIALGEAVRLRFRKPHSLSASVRLEFVSRHRTQPWADGVLLMAESCVLGPNWHNHVVCRDWKDDVVFFRQDGDLFCRGMESLEIDGHSCDGQGRVTHNSRVAGEDFSVTLEEIK